MNCAVHNQSQAVAYCRTCGKALCEECKRDVMGAIYCEPCIAARLQGQPGVAAGAVPPPPVPRQPVVPGAPNPAVAGILGFIPGVGAMYNGQFVKAFVHVVIFILLIFASDHISGLFGLGIAFWVFYMAFEAYKTAESRRFGLPAPDPLGLDKMFGLQDSQTAAAYVALPANPAVAAPVQPVTPVQVAPPPAPVQDNAPTGALVLIALGAIFLLSNNFSWFDADRLWPLLLIGIGLWIAYKRTGQQTGR